MTLRLTPDAIEGAYEFLRRTAPFKNWKLPDADEVEIRVTRHPNTFGYHRGVQRDLQNHEIGISDRLVKDTDTLLRTLGHEMIHQYQQRNRSETPNTEHNAEFKRLARLVCKTHGWNIKSF